MCHNRKGSLIWSHFLSLSTKNFAFISFPRTGVCIPLAWGDLFYIFYMLAPCTSIYYDQPSRLILSEAKKTRGTIKPKARTWSQRRNIVYIKNKKKEQCFYSKINSTNVHYQLNAGIYNVCALTNTQELTPIWTERLWGTVLSPEK